jgi:hypothetical protein
LLLLPCAGFRPQIVVFHDGLELDATRQLAGYLQRASGGVWRLGSRPTLKWLANARVDGHGQHHRGD